MGGAIITLMGMGLPRHGLSFLTASRGKEVIAITGSSNLLSREASVTGHYSDMEQGQFVSELDKTWQALNDVKKVIQEHVRAGNLRPIDGIRGFSAMSANILGYEEFVPRTATNPVFQSTS